MSERYQKLFQLEHRLYAPHAPVLIESGLLLLEQRTGSVLCQLCFRSIQDRPIKGLRVEVQMLDEAGNPLGKSVSHRYQELDLRRDGSFGKGRAIVLPDAQAKAFTAHVSQVSFADGELWNDEEQPWSPLPDQQLLEEAFENEKQLEQFIRRFGKDSIYAPLETEELWFCTCGGVNHNSEPRCHACQLRRSALLGKGAAVSSEEPDDMDYEEPSPDGEPRRRGLRAALWVIFAALLVALVVVLLPRLKAAMVGRNTPAVSPAPVASAEARQEPEAEASQEPEAESTPAAEEPSVPTAVPVTEPSMPPEEELRPTPEQEEPESAASPSPEAVISLPAETEEPVAEPEEDPRADAYDKAAALLERAASAPREEAAALYQQAAEAFEELTDYLDSADQAAKCRKEIEQLQELQDAYTDAKALLDDGNYADAREAFLALGDYEDSEDMAKEAVYRKCVALLDFLESHPLKGVTASLSMEAGEESLIFVPREQLLELGTDGMAELNACFGQDPVRFVEDDDPDIPEEELAQAAVELLDSLGDYRDSEEIVTRLLEDAAPADDFFALCAAGDLLGARDWLNKPGNSMEDRDLWLARINRFLPYTGDWKLNVGDRNLVSYIGGGHDSNYNVTCVVILTEEEAILRFLVHPGDKEGPELHCELDETYFYKDRYVAQINPSGNLIVALYPAGNQNPTRSTEYVRARG